MIRDPELILNIHNHKIMETRFGDRKIRYADSLHEYVEYIQGSMSEHELHNLFHEAKHSEEHSTFFSVKHGVHLCLIYKSSGHYTLERA